jgi:hypothetical protein
VRPEAARSRSCFRVAEPLVPPPPTLRAGGGRSGWRKAQCRSRRGLLLLQPGACIPFPFWGMSHSIRTMRAAGRA